MALILNLPLAGRSTRRSPLVSPPAAGPSITGTGHRGRLPTEGHSHGQHRTSRRHRHADRGAQHPGALLRTRLAHQGCETIRIIRDQDDPDHVAGLTQWTERQDYTGYLGWRTARGFTGTFEAMLTRPLVISYYDELYAGQGIAAVTASGAGRRPR